MLKVRRLSIAATIAIVVGAGLTACSDSRWCEHDATNTRVADRYCEQNTPGYEWESGSKHKKSTKVYKSKKSKSSKSKSSKTKVKH
jgi:hypothetical protein